jgi:hypothetical protein
MMCKLLSRKDMIKSPSLNKCQKEVEMHVWVCSKVVVTLVDFLEEISNSV